MTGTGGGFRPRFRGILAAGAGVVAACGLVTVALERVLAARRRSPARPIDVSVEIAAPREAVWAAISDVQRQPAWMREMKSVRILPPGPVGRGTTGEATVRILGISVTDPVEIVEWEPPRRFAIRHRGLFRGGGRLVLREGVPAAPGIPPTTVVTWREVLIPPVLPHVGALIQWPILRWIFQDDLYRFRSLVEDAPGWEAATGGQAGRPRGSGGAPVD